MDNKIKYMSALGIAAAAVFSLQAAKPGAAKTGEATEGALYVIDKDSQKPTALCPLKHTDVNAEISGYLARVSVVQEFTNDSKTPIEAVYKFPLPHDAAVDSMEMWIGKRVIKAQIKKKEDARKIYNDARNNGQRASLLDQERPNLFTQHVANIMPGDTVKIHIQYVETLKYEDGDYEFVFPMVVGPRYTPAEMANPEAVRVNRTPQGTRAGHDINVKVSVNAGMEIGPVSSPSHNIDVLQGGGKGVMMVALKNAQSIPNKDFILRYAAAGAKIKDAVLLHRNPTNHDGFFTLIMQPPDRVAESEITPKEIVFVIDTSGSMHGYPMDKIKETIRYAFDGLHPRDTFNLITFSGDEHILFPKPVPATRENINTAWEFMKTRDGRGGTEMMKAIRAAFAGMEDHPEKVRIVCFMTDGEVGNDMEILAEIRRNSNARVFAFGIGNSVNRFLLDGMGRQGRGETQFVTLTEDGSAAAKTFHQRVHSPLLTDIQIDWNGLPIADVYPQRINDMFAAKPLVLNGRFDGKFTGKRTIRIHGKVAGKPYQKDIEIDFAAANEKHNVLATMWARRKVEELTASDYRNINYGNPNAEVKQQITDLGLKFRLMTQFTSFVAVEDKVVNEGGRQHTVQVPVEMPEGVSYDRVGGEMRKLAMQASYAPSSFAPKGGVELSAPMPAMDAGRVRQTVRPVRAEEKEAPVLAIAAKIHPSLMNLPATQTVRVTIWLSTQTSPAVLARLKAAGFTFATGSGQMLTGTVQASDLEKLAAISEVRAISPAASSLR
ncbi:inter-alpha-trypsin inhibitor domain-containing protein [Bryobacterales bacterium F-183]|nr:inter-alpha-trypsin inhibitor domain-containing protein [Bryobacterales bacterium F-183]